MRPPGRSTPALAGGAALVALLAWQGHRVEHALPAFERVIAELGPWGPIGLALAIVLLGPLLIPDSVFGVTAGACFGLGLGSAAYFAGAYPMCLLVQWASGRWLGARVLRLLAAEPRLRAVVAAAREGGPRLTFLIRLLPVNQALLSYALGAAGAPLRFALLGNVAMLAHILPTVYVGAVAAHVTRMAASRHREWETGGVLFVLGLVACVLVTIQVTRRAWAAIEARERAAPDAAPRAPAGA
ncbi:MAG: hypothetical protein OZ948_00550 [Deltaproteobacteria bacterium]|nr:hypothetical protein [Deltaproteobacteria bacterium]